MRLIGICGFPKAGKSTIQEVLEDEFGLYAADDGRILRDFAKRLFGLSELDVSTQEGKKRKTEIEGVEWENRDVLGTLGRIIEQTFGELAIPNAAIREVMNNPVVRSNHRGASFGSVRKVQGAAYKRHGGVIIEIVRPGCGPTGYDFDEYDRSYIDRTFFNDAPDVATLKRQFAAWYRTEVHGHV